MRSLIRRAGPAILAFCGLGLLIYGRTITAAFQFDDYPTIVDNPYVKNIFDLAGIWRWDPSRFLTHLSFALNYAVGGLNPAGFHLVNVGLHVVNALTVWALSKRLWGLTGADGRERGAEAFAILAALIFLSHPLQTAAVSYIVQRAALLATFFYLTAVYLYLRFRAEGGRRWLFWSLAAGMCGALCKPIVVTLPLTIALLELFIFAKARRDIPRAVALSAAYTIVAALVILALWLWRGDTTMSAFNAVTRVAEDISRRDYAVTQIQVLTRYLRLLLFPVGQNLDYDWPLTRDLWTPGTLSRLALLGGLILFAGWLFPRRRIMALGIAWFFVTVIPESSIFPLPDVIFEHRMYLPMAGCSWVLADLILEFRVSRRVKAVAAAALVAVSSLLSFQRNAVWRTPESLWQDVIAKSPGKARAYLNLGKTRFEQGNFYQAEQNFRETLQRDPASEEALNNLGLIAKSRGDAEGALRFYAQALQINGNYLEAYNNRGYLRAELGEYEAALEDYNRAIALNPDYEIIYNNRGNLFLRQGQYEAALADFNRAVQINPRYGKAYHNRGVVYRLQDSLFGIPVVEAPEMPPPSAAAPPPADERRPEELTRLPPQEGTAQDAPPPPEVPQTLPSIEPRDALNAPQPPPPPAMDNVVKAPPVSSPATVAPRLSVAATRRQNRYHTSKNATPEGTKNRNSAPLIIESEVTSPDPTPPQPLSTPPQVPYLPR